MTTEDQYILATKTLNGRLFSPYQKEGVMWMLNMENQKSGPKGGFLCDEMGLGKTVQLISTLIGNLQSSTLIIVPKSIITQWRDEINTFAPNLSVNVYDGPDRKIDHSCNITIAPYTVITVKGAENGGVTPLHHVQWDRIILDEAHEIRNSGSSCIKVYVVCVPLLSGS